MSTCSKLKVINGSGIFLFSAIDELYSNVRSWVLVAVACGAGSCVKYVFVSHEFSVASLMAVILSLNLYSRILHKSQCPSSFSRPLLAADSRKVVSQPCALSQSPKLYGTTNDAEPFTARAFTLDWRPFHERRGVKSCRSVAHQEPGLSTQVQSSKMTRID
ncbi:hypothetical protein M378DRAFT_215962 [Amanita muscaria Koide BX008]|uniref:Uncharacterized protein n=1 Tax=Amanita muscaria (strain Koide BX008) TaxID=946122 RepID=A0A0C2TVN7_AMAMK|nr:hypothetical protein M378DRAFT_215962 [Amanita muscaria Koide BX008]